MTQRKVALVTGVSSGIGVAISSLLSKRGFQVFGTMRKPDQTAGTLKDIEVVRLDVCDEESVRSCVQTVLGLTGRIDALVNNAGFIFLGSLEETSMDEARQVFDTNFFGILRMCQAVLPIMRKQNYGRIVNIGSVMGFLPGPYQGIYAASKHAVEGYSESLDHETRQFGIRVSVVEPGFMRTNLGVNGQTASRSLQPYAAERERVFEALRAGITNGEEPVVVASTVVTAIESSNPQHRYPAGRKAKVLSLLRRYAPSGLLDKGLRKQFRLDAV